MFNPLKVRLMRAVCGLDVHKDSVYLCILNEDGELIEKVFGVLTFQLQQMRDLLLTHHVDEVSMESTSVYWIPIWRILAPHFLLRLVNPYFIKQLPGHKSDVADAQWIAECTMKNLVSGSFVPPEDIQQLRQYDRRIFDLDEEIVRKLSKLDAVMQRCNIRLSNYVSNVDCKSYKDVVRKISEGVTDPEVLIEEIHGRIIKHHGRETILASLTGVISQAEIDVLRQLREELDLAEEHKQECLERMLKICQEKYPDELRRLQTIPGVKERTATSLIAEIGTDMSKFETANHLAAWSGLRPRNDESNKKFKSRRITHGNVYLRKNIIQCAWAASRTKSCFFSRFSYHQTQVRKKNKMKVIVAVARKLLVAVWHVIHDETDYVDFQQKQDRQVSATNG
jgi:transposase